MLPTFYIDTYIHSYPLAYLSVTSCTKEYNFHLNDVDFYVSWGSSWILLLFLANTSEPFWYFWRIPTLMKLAKHSTLDAQMQATALSRVTLWSVQELHPSDTCRTPSGPRAQEGKQLCWQLHSNSRGWAGSNHCAGVGVAEPAVRAVGSDEDLFAGPVGRFDLQAKESVSYRLFFLN